MKKEKGRLLSVLKGVKWLIPGTWLRTFVYLHGILAVRNVLRQSINTFYRIDHVYDVIAEFRKHYKGKFSILEFGVADGYAFTKKLYAVRYLNMEDRITVHGFDTFEGLPDTSDQADRGLVRGGGWTAGHYRGRYDDLLTYCRKRYRSFELHKGLFEETLTDAFLQTLIEQPPILIWIDCDYYSSTKTVLSRILPYVPSGCVLYFDDIYFNFSSRFTGEMKAVWEINQGLYGEGVELVPDPALSWDSNRVYRFINANASREYELVAPLKKDPVRRRGDDSPLP